MYLKANRRSGAEIYRFFEIFRQEMLCVSLDTYLSLGSSKNKGNKKCKKLCLSTTNQLNSGVWGQPLRGTWISMAIGQTTKRVQSPDPVEWVDLYGDMLLSYALSRMQDRDIAEDLVQETFLVAWKTRSKFAGRSRFSTWLVSILRHKIADHFRREGGRTSHSFDESDESRELESLFNKRGKWTRSPKSWSASAEELVENREFWRIVAGCLGDMPAHLSYVFRLREFKSAKTQEISSLLEITSSNVSVRLHRARLLLRQCLEEKWFE